MAGETITVPGSQDVVLSTVYESQDVIIAALPVKGEPGDLGPQGPQGPQGNPGPSFEGTAWWYGSGAPQAIIGSKPGDYYFDVVSGTVYRLGD